MLYGYLNRELRRFFLAPIDPRDPLIVQLITVFTVLIVPSFVVAVYGGMICTFFMLLNLFLDRQYLLLLVGLLLIVGTVYKQLRRPHIKAWDILAASSSVVFTTFLTLQTLRVIALPEAAVTFTNLFMKGLTLVYLLFVPALFLLALSISGLIILSRKKQPGLARILYYPLTIGSLMGGLLLMVPFANDVGEYFSFALAGAVSTGFFIGSNALYLILKARRKPVYIAN